MAAPFKGRVPALEFLRELRLEDQIKMQHLFDWSARDLIANREKYKLLDAGIFEFKSKQIRMPCFESPGGLLVVTHGFIKKKDEAPPAEVRRGKEIKAWFEKNEDTIKAAWPYSLSRS